VTEEELAEIEQRLAAWRSAAMVPTARPSAWEHFLALDASELLVEVRRVRKELTRLRPENDRFLALYHWSEHDFNCLVRDTYGRGSDAPPPTPPTMPRPEEA